MTTFLVFCELPLHTVKVFSAHAANQPHLTPAPASTLSFLANGNVRLLRHPQESDRTRFALSGKMSDVCQTLDRLAQQESEGIFKQAGLH